MANQHASMTNENVELLVAQARNEADNPAYKVSNFFLSMDSASRIGRGREEGPAATGRFRFVVGSSLTRNAANRRTFQCK